MNRELLFEHCKEAYGTTPEYLWERYPSHAVLRHRGNRKWYAVIMEIPFKRLGIMREGNVDVMNVKLGEAMVGSVLDERGIFPAYHMAKGAWVSVLLDGTVSDETILAFLDISHEQTNQKGKKQ